MNEFNSSSSAKYETIDESTVAYSFSPRGPEDWG